MTSFVQLYQEAVSGELPVKSQCLPFRQIPHTTRLFNDFLSWSPSIQPFYSRSPHFAAMVQGRSSGNKL